MINLDKIQPDKYRTDRLNVNLAEYFEAADKGHVTAMYELAVHYERGIYTVKDDRKAFEWYKKASHAGFKAAKFKLAQYHENGFGTKKNEKLAFELYKDVAEDFYNSSLEDAKGYFHKDVIDLYGYFIYKQRFINDKITDMKIAMKKIADTYENGTIIPKDELLAFEWYKKAAYAGDVDSMKIIANYYEKGGLISIDDSQAFLWYKRIAENGDSTIMCKVGMYYQEGFAVKKNEYQAFEWYKKSAEKSNPLGAFMLANCYETGVGIPRDRGKAFKWFKEASKHGAVPAMGKVAHYYKNGIGTVKDEHKAFEYFKKITETKIDPLFFDVISDVLCHASSSLDACFSIRMNSSIHSDLCLLDAMYHLGIFYENGISVAKNNRTALLWYLKAAEKGHPYAQFEVGRCYKDGTGAEQDDERAIKWFIKAAKKGHDKAILEINEYSKDNTVNPNVQGMAIEWLKNSASINKNDEKRETLDEYVSKLINNNTKIDEDTSIAAFVEDVYNKSMDYVGKLFKKFF